MFCQYILSDSFHYRCIKLRRALKNIIVSTYNAMVAAVQRHQLHQAALRVGQGHRQPLAAHLQIDVAVKLRLSDGDSSRKEAVDLTEQAAQESSAA